MVYCDIMIQLIRCELIHLTSGLKLIVATGKGAIQNVNNSVHVIYSFCKLYPHVYETRNLQNIYLVQPLNVVDQFEALIHSGMK